MKQFSLALLLCLLLVITGCFLFFGNFDKEKWIDEKGNVGSNNSRAGMIKDLEKNYLKVGMSKENVIEILGDPESRYDLEDGGEVFVYDLGMIIIDNEWYKVFFDKNNKVVKLWREQG